MKERFCLITFVLIFTVGSGILIHVGASENEASELKPKHNSSLVHLGFLTGDSRPSFWTKSASSLKPSNAPRAHKPGVNTTKLPKRVAPGQLTTENIPVPTRRIRQWARTTTEGTTTGDRVFETTTLSHTESDDIEDRIMKDKTFIALKEFASQFINETANILTGSKDGQSRSYQADESPPIQLWDDKDQTYHASTFSNSDYEPASYHHYVPPPPMHYYPPHKKEDTFLTKVAVIALLKLILAKLKAIGFLKLMFLFMMKIPIMFFKFLFIVKGFKLLKLVSIPFIIASFAAPFLPMLPLLAPLLFAPLLLAPLLLPLLLPLLFFLPLIPVSTPATAAAATRKRRDITFNAPIENNGNETRGWNIRNRSRPVSYEALRKNPFEYVSRSDQYEETESPNLLELTQRILDSQRCMERVACELACQNESKIYQTAVIWALRKVHDYASPGIRQKIERYTEAYKTGAKRQASEYCQNKFHCQRPKVFLIQGDSKYNVF